MNTDSGKDRSHLRTIARRVMIERGLIPEFSPQVLAELDNIRGHGQRDEKSARDLRHLPWCSIDNKDTRDIDQLTVAEEVGGGGAKILVAIADVDSLVGRNSAIDEHARLNTTSVYTPAKIFPLLPEKLSTDLTSLNYSSERYAMVVEMIVAPDGSLQGDDVYPALVLNRAKLAYDSVAAWLERTGPMPKEIGAVPGLAENIALQNRYARLMKALRLEAGALTFDTVEARPEFEEGQIRDVIVKKKNRAQDIIEDFMIAANGVTARFLALRGLPSLRRVVRTPKRWDRIVELARDNGFTLPPAPDPRALEQFLARAKASDPLRFPDLSVSVIKLLGKGEYAVENPGDAPEGHFGLAVKDYAHSTAPNRRYPDIITQRLLNAAVTGQPLPYGKDELAALARHCTEKEDAAKKAERHVRKSAMAMLLRHRVGERFDAIITGAAEKGTWVRVFQPPVEGRLARGYEGMDVGQRLRVELIAADVERGFIDFKRVQ